MIRSRRDKWISGKRTRRKQGNPLGGIAALVYSDDEGNIEKGIEERQ